MPDIITQKLYCILSNTKVHYNGIVFYIRFLGKQPPEMLLEHEADQLILTFLVSSVQHYYYVMSSQTIL